MHIIRIEFLQRKRAKIVLGVCIAFVLLVSFTLNRDEQTERRQQLEIPLEWARLAPYPTTARDLQSSTLGTMFTRSFRVAFSAPAVDVQHWLEISPGTREVKPDVIAPGRRHFAIKPGGGAQHAEVTVDDQTEHVDIYVYWS